MAKIGVARKASVAAQHALLKIRKRVKLGGDIKRIHREISTSRMNRKNLVDVGNAWNGRSEFGSFASRYLADKAIFEESNEEVLKQALRRKQRQLRGQSRKRKKK